KRRGFGLAVTVADDEAPGSLDLVDHLRIERFARAADLAQADLEVRELLLDEQPPHRGRRAERGDAAAADGGEQLLGLETRLVDDEDRRPRIPRREEATPGVLGPARRGDIEMHVAGLQPEPVHRRQRANGIAAMAVANEL